MVALSISFAAPGIQPKLPSGPIDATTPGPELVIQVTEALNAVAKSISIKASNTVETVIVAKKATINTNTDETAAGAMVYCFTLTGTTRLGSTAVTSDWRR